MWLTLPHSFLRSGRCSSRRVSLFCYTRSLNPHSWLLLPPKPQCRDGIYSVLFFYVGSRHLEFLLACLSLVLIGLSHFLQFTLTFGSRRVHFVIPQSYIPHFTPLRQRTQEHSFRSLVSFSLRYIHVQGRCLFPPTNPVAVALLRCTPQSIATPHIQPLPFIPLIPLHTLTPFLPLPFPTHPFRQKNAPALP